MVCTADGHQTPILTSLPGGVGAARIACLMFARWRQETSFATAPAPRAGHLGQQCLARRQPEDDPQPRAQAPDSRHCCPARDATAQQLRAELGTRLFEGGSARAARRDLGRRLADIETESRRSACSGASPPRCAFRSKRLLHVVSLSTGRATDSAAVARKVPELPMGRGGNAGEDGTEMSGQVVRVACPPDDGADPSKPGSLPSNPVVSQPGRIIRSAEPARRFRG